MGPMVAMVAMVAILPWALLCPVTAMRDDLKSGSLTLDSASEKCEETQKTRELLRQLGYRGPLDGDHCRLPGITCGDDNCQVEELECETCSGLLPERIQLRSLWKVLLTNRNLKGDIAAFQGMKELYRLQVSGTQVTGNIAAFQGMTELRYLHLDGTGVHGDLRALAELRLDVLDLTATAVGGRLQDLAGKLNSDGSSKMFFNLHHLLLGNTRVTGNLSALTAFPHIKEVDLSNTAVTGGINFAWTGECHLLRTLKLRNSSVHFAPQGEDFEELKRQQGPGKLDHVLRSLKELDVSHCPVNSAVEKLLLPLAMSAQLLSIEASGSGLSGAIPKLRDTDATVNGHNESNFTYPAAKSLVMLDLSDNNVSEVQDLPVKPGLGRILLRQNQQVRVEPMVLVEAQRQEIMLDLSGVQAANEKEFSGLLSEDLLHSTDMLAYRNESAGYACKEVVGSVKVTPQDFLPELLCKCLPGWHGMGATCQICPADEFSNETGLKTCLKCPANSRAPPGAAKIADCICKFGTLHHETCSCDLHQALQKESCASCAKLHVQCKETGSLATTAVPEVNHARLEAHAEEAHRCLPPVVAERCPGSHECGAGYAGILCATCAEGFWARGGRCQPCTEANSTTVGILVFVGVAAVVAAAFVAYHRTSGQQAPQQTTVKTSLQGLMLRQGPVLLQLVQLWSVLSQLQQRNSSGKNLPEVPYLETLQLTTTELQNSFNLQCTFHAETVRTLAALSSPLAPLLLLGCCAALELYQVGLGVNAAVTALTFLYIGGASSTAELLSCQSEDGDGKSLENFAFRKALRHIRCSQTDGVAFWVNAVGTSSAVAYAVLIPLFLAGVMVRQHFVCQEARLCTAYAEEEPHQITISVQRLPGKVSEVRPKRLLAAAAAHMATYCRGKRLVQLHDGFVTISEEVEEVQQEDELDIIKFAADKETSQKIDALRSRRLVEMLTERIMLDETEDRLMIGSKRLLCKYTLCQDIWMDVAMKLFAVALVSCVSIADGWKWAFAFSLGMAVLVGVCQPYMQPQVSQLQSLSCFCLALASVAFIYDCAGLARAALVAPVMLLLWQARCPDCMEALAERLYKELQSELPKLEQKESHAVLVKQLRF